MSELIDRSVLRARMYTEAFESDTDMQKWDSGCWIRYKLFEKVVDNMPTVPYSPRWHRGGGWVAEGSRRVYRGIPSLLLG